MAKITTSDPELLEKINKSYDSVFGILHEGFVTDLTMLGIGEAETFTITNSKGEKVVLTINELFASLKKNVTENYSLEIVKWMIKK